LPEIPSVPRGDFGTLGVNVGLLQGGVVIELGCGGLGLSSWSILICYEGFSKSIILFLSKKMGA